MDANTEAKAIVLHPAKISVNSVDNITDIMPDLNVSFI